MDILILNWKDIKHPQTGGAEIIVYELAKRLVKDGHNVTWFCRSFPQATPEENIDGIRIIRRGNLVTMYLLAPIFYWSEKEKPDLVIDCSNTIYWQTPIWAWRSRKVAYLNQLAKEVFWYEYPPIVSHLGWLIERLQYLTYLNISFLCYANSTKQDLISTGIPAGNINVFPLGLDHSRYHPGAKSSTPLFISVSRLVKMKRTDLAIRAIDIVRRSYPKVKLVIVGTGYDRSRLQKLRDNLHLESQVEFADENVWFFKKNNRDIKLKLMQQAWALIFPSVKEGWGMTVTECAACGTPAVVSDVTGLRDSVLNDKTGIILSSNPSSEEIAESMIKIIKDEKLRDAFYTNCLNWADKFDWDKSFSRFHKLINYVSEIK